MQERQKQYKNSPYLNAFKTKDCSFLPKINKFDNPERRQFASKSNQKHNEQSIYKMKNQQIEIMRPVQVDMERIFNSKQYNNLQKQIEQLQRTHQQQSAELEQRISKIQKILATRQKSTYDYKYSIWQLRNQILSLQAELVEEQAQYDSLISTRGINRNQYAFNSQLNPEHQQYQPAQQQQQQQFGQEQQEEGGSLQQLQILKPNDDGRYIEQLQQEGQFEGKFSRLSQLNRMEDDNSSFQYTEHQNNPTTQLTRFN